MRPRGATPGGSLRPGRLVPGERALLHGTAFAVGLSGTILAAVKYLLPAPDDPFVAWNHPSQPYLLHAHVLAGPLLVFAIGWIARDHILHRLRDRHRWRGRRTGRLATLQLLPMVGSGYLLQVVTHEGLRRALVWLHVVSGVVFFAAYVAHLLVARWNAAAAPEPASGRWAADGLHLREALRRGPGMQQGGLHPLEPGERG